MHRPHPRCARCAPVQQVQKVSADGIVLGLDVNAGAAVTVVIPVGEHGAHGCDQPVRNIARRGRRMRLILRQSAAEHGDPGAQDVHGMRCGRQNLEHCAHCRRQAAQGGELRLVGRKLRAVGELAVDKKIRDFLEFAGRRDLQNVVAAIVQVVARAAHAGERGIARRHSGERHGFLGRGRLRRCLLLVFSQVPSPKSSSSLRS